MGFFVTLSLLSSLAAIQALPHPQDEDCPEPSSLQWHPCGDIGDELAEGLPIPLPIECASLPVPLDYTDPESETLDLSLLRVNATKEPVRGSILFNPGGPGGSGVEYVAAGSENLHEVLGGNFNLIGFDPRGTGYTLPFDCNVTTGGVSIARRDIIAADHNMTEDLFAGGWDAAESFADSCYEQMSDVGGLLGTAFVVRDMVNIIDALGEDGLLRYWGLSYGTFLGATFAAMFPERVDRVVLDGVANPHEYMAGPWMTSLSDADKAFFAFLSECVDSPDRCALARYNGPTTTASDLLELINAKLEGLSATPEGSTLYSTVKFLIHRALYTPRDWPSTAEALLGFLNGTEIDPSLLSSEPSDTYNKGINAHEGIKCSDTYWRADSPDEITDVVVQQSQTSGFSDAWYPYTWRCAAWKMDAKERYSGNFTAKTKNPILLVGGEYDPITPLAAAYNTSAGFEGSFVLPRSGYGHGLNSHPSVCAAKALRSYFLNWELPEPGTVCDPDIDVFDLGTPLETSQKLSRRDALPEEDVKILRSMMALDELSQARSR